MHIFAALLIAGGSLCFSPNECVQTAAAKVDVKASDADRRYVWTSRDGTHVILGKLAAHATSVDLEAKEPVRKTATLSIRGDARRGWPAETKFTIAQKKEQWLWTIAPKLAGKTIAIEMPVGDYALSATADHHRTERRPLRGNKDADLGQLTLEPLPVITGRVVTPKSTEDGQPPKDVGVHGAQLAREDGKNAATTNEQGVFRAELAEPIPQEVIINTPGLASKIVPLRFTGDDLDLGTIQLTAGVKLAVHIDRAEPVRPKTLHVTLFSETPGRYENTRFASHDLRPGDDDLVFDDLGKGQYYVVVAGDAPLERLTTPIAVGGRDSATTIRIAPFTLQGSVLFGDEPLHGGAMSINDAGRQHVWRAEGLPIDQNGRFGGTMWQVSSIFGWLHSEETGTIPVTESPNLSGDPAIWDIKLPRRMITGRVFDAETNHAIEGANVELQSEASDGNRLYGSVPLKGDGTFSLLAMREGVYDLTAQAPGFIVAHKSVEIARTDPSKSVEFPLSHGIEQVIDFVWPSGDPVGNAEIIEGVARDGHNAAWYSSTDPAGRLTLRMRPDTARTIFVVPQQGSFAAVRVVPPRSAADSKPLRVVVPPAAGKVTATVVDAAGKRVPGQIVMRYNGEFVPYSVVTRVHEGMLPAGAYELWAIGGPMTAVLTPPARPGVAIGLSAGEQKVDLIAGTP